MLPKRFQVDVPVLIVGPGEYHEGDWIDAGYKKATIRGVIEPVDRFDYDRLRPLMEAQHVKFALRMYTDPKVRLTIAGENNSSGDVVVWPPSGPDSKRYRITHRSDWTAVNNVSINHWRYLMMWDESAEYLGDEQIVATAFGEPLIINGDIIGVTGWQTSTTQN